MNDRTYYFNRWLMTYGTPEGFADWWRHQIKLHGGAMTTDPRVPFSCSMHKSAADKIERYVAKIVRAEKVKRGAIIERMLLESIKKEEA